MKKKLMLIAYRAFGDWLYSIPVLPYLFEKYDVHLECNKKVYSLVYDDPRFTGISVFDDNDFLKQVRENPDFNQHEELKKHLQSVYEEVKPDEVMDLSNSLEFKCIADSNQEIFRKSREERAKKFEQLDYYEAIFDHLKIPLPEKINLDTMFFDPAQIQKVSSWSSKHTSDFVVLIPVMGSCMQKFYPKMPEVVNYIIDKYHNAHVYLLGEKDILEDTKVHERIHDLTGKIPIKQAVLMTKYADYVIGPETGLLVAAGMFGTHKTMLCNTVKVSQVCGKHKNDHSLQSRSKCSPCHKGIYVESDCDNVKYFEGTPYSGCVDEYDFKEITRIIDNVYEQRNIYNENYHKRYADRGTSEIGKQIYSSRWDLIEKYCHGTMTLLDYGCASGAFHLSSRNGFIATGYDVNPHSPFHLNTVGMVDILTMWDVIEHLHDPLEPIKKYNPKYLFISTPNLHNEVDFGTWKHNRPMEHLHYFNLKSLSRLVEKEGYKVLEHNFDEGRLRDSEKPEDIITLVAVKA